MTQHTPVLLNEVMALLEPKSGETFIDCTFGGGGHSKKILEKIGKDGKLLAIDWNLEAINLCKLYAKEFRHVECLNANFADLLHITKKINFPKADGLLIDLGISSDELESSGRGFSFQKNEPLFMTFSNEQKPVRTILKELKLKELEKVIRDFGEERYAGRIAVTIKETLKKHPIETTLDLVSVIVKATPSHYHHQRIHPATRTFMALRIYANKELENLEKILTELKHIMNAEGRVAVISFHSLEDRLVKNYFRNLRKENCAELLTKKPITPSLEEMQQNPRARSAKLRAIKINDNC